MTDDELDDMLGIDRSDPLSQLADLLTREDYDWIGAIVKIRKAAGLTLDEVARWMGTTREKVADLESVNADPRLSTMRRYAMAVGVAVTHGVEQA